MANSNTFQVKHDEYRWEDLELGISSLENLAKMISASPFDETINQMPNEDLPNFWAHVLNYHGCYSAHQLKNGRIFDVVDEDINVDSFDHDVLKISYHFTIRYESSYDREPRLVKGKITLMP